MTERAKPVVRPRRRAWEGPERRNFLLNVGFGLVVVVALLVLVAYVAYTWYDDHLSSIASVNGQGITKDEFNKRAQVETVRLSIAEARITDERNAGRLTDEQFEAQKQFILQRQQQLGAITLERLIDARIQAELATREQITITDADIDAKLLREATRSEQRRAWVIEVEPKVEANADEPTAGAIAEARKKAGDALKELQAGKDWVEVAKAVSTASSASVGGEVGYITKESGLEQTLIDALFALEKDAPTAVIEGEDGTFRIGRVTDIVAEVVDPDYTALVTDRGVTLEDYRAAVRQDLAGDKLKEKIEGLALASGPQREVAEIFLENSTLPEATNADAVKVRHILYSPKDDPDGAPELPADDPAWKEAEDAARAAYAKIKAKPDTFDEVAREESDEGGADISGGKLPWFDPSQSEDKGGGLDKDFAVAIFKADLEPGDLLEPVKTKFGWHVIQVMYFPTDLAWAKQLKAEIEGGADFATLARDNSSAEEATDGGKLGWVGKYQLDPASEAAIFATPIGKVSEPVSVDGDGVHLYLVTKEETRTPEGEQKAELEQTAFTNWYEAQKKSFDVKREIDFSSAG